MIEEVRRDAMDRIIDLREGQPKKYQMILDQIIDKVQHMHIEPIAGPEEE